MTRLRRLAAVLALAVTSVLVAPLAAHAVGYQFWGYYHLVDGEWAFAVEGVATTVPEDGTVQGLRFAVSSGEDVRSPRDVLAFDDVCADVPAEDGSKRVALVIDPGRDVDAPEGATPPGPGAQCVAADPDATMLDLVRQAVGDVRTDEADMLCGLARFPATGCSDEVAEPSPEQLAPDEPIEIPVVPVGSAIVTPPTDGQPTEQSPPTEQPTDSGQPTGQTTEGEAGTGTATEPPTDPTTGEGTAGDPTTEETASGDGAASTTPSETPDEAAAEDEEPGEGVPPWAWVVGVLVLLGILALVATSARNRRLRDAQGMPYDEGFRDASDGPSRGGPDDRSPRDGEGR
ncbi:SCO2322 family protein [Ornithinimicrobium cavernae]|uniref:SCO2322 family protein n=1 Tax=Ornithinimicrobium cavernae TaxID=2666047 RepID=UPI000D692199|nr:SCO2322 family protein [Ornithinimicrobium cavernae]